jgi:hypothetical protein
MLNLRRLLFLAVLAGVALASPAIGLTPQLVVSRNLPGNFLGNQSVWANGSFVFCVNYQGTLYVIQESNWKIAATIQVSSGLEAATGDAANVYLASADGFVYVYSAVRPFRLVAKKQVSLFPLRNIYVDPSPNGDVLVSIGQTTMTATPSTVFMSMLNAGETVLALNKRTLNAAGGGQPVVFGTLIEGTTVAYSRFNGLSVGQISNPPAFGGAQDQAGMTVLNGQLVLYTPGCCGSGFFTFAASTLSSEVTFTNGAAFTDSVAVADHGRYYVAGTEAGTVGTFDHSGNLQGEIDLAAATGHPGAGEVEVRGISNDGDGLVFATSSHNDAAAPSFFVLQVK